MLVLLLGMLITIFSVVRYSELHEHLLGKMRNAKDMDAITNEHDEAQKVLSLHACFSFAGLFLMVIGFILMNRGFA